MIARSHCQGTNQTGTAIAHTMAVTKKTARFEGATFIGRVFARCVHVVNFAG
jgi:hypothetical protein